MTVISRDFHETTYMDFIHYLCCPRYRMLHTWIQQYSVVQDVLLSCSRNPHIVRRSPASWCEPPDHYQDIIQSTTSAYATHQWKRQFKQVESHGLPWTILRMFSHLLICGATTLSDCTETDTRESVSSTVWWTKHILNQNLLGGKMPSVFFYSSAGIAKSIHEMQVIIFAVGNHQRHCSDTSQLNRTTTTAESEVLARSGLHMVRIRYELKCRHAQCQGNTSC
jgi:hypothetical protein